MESIENRRARVIQAIVLLKKATITMQEPMSTMIVELYGRDPFLILISCLLSLRARDPVTFEVSKKLFERVRTPEELLKISIHDLEKMFYPLGFYRRKAKIVIEVTQDLIARFKGKVPSNEADLLSIKGVGRKTANLVLAEAFGIPGLIVDTHVHQVSNRLGWVNTKTPEATELELQKIVPKEDWIVFNRLMVVWGQNICVPISPFCSKCVLSPMCPKIGVTKRRR